MLEYIAFVLMYYADAKET